MHAVQGAGAVSRNNYTDANPIFTGAAARHRDAMRRVRLGAVLDTREGMHVGVVESRVECGNFRR